MPNISDIKIYLEVLDLDTSRMPTMKEYKQAYRLLLRLHPDLGGDTTRFQEITLAAREVFQFITKHQDEKTKPDSGSDSDLLKAFEATNNVSYNTGNIVFGIDPSETDTWVKCLEKRLGKPLSLETGGALQFKVDELKIPHKSPSSKADFGSVTVTVWPNPKTTHPKAMVQGKYYIAFVTFILPLVIKDIKATTKSHTQPGRLGLAHESDESSEDEACLVSDSGAITKALSRLEKEVLCMRNDLVDRIDAAKGASDHVKLDKRLESLEGLIRDDIQQHAKLTASIDSLRDTMTLAKSEVQLDSEQLNELARNISSNHKNQVSALTSIVTDIKSDMAQASKLTAVQDKVNNMNTLLDQVHSTALKVDHNIKDMKSDIQKISEVSGNMIQMKKNSDESLKMFQAMMGSLKNIESSKNKTFSTPPPTAPSKSSNEVSNGSEVPLRKGIMFCSSIALNSDVKRYKDELNVDLKIIPTDYILENTCTQDRDAFLGCMVNQHLRGNSEYSFAILATGEKDITDLDVDNSPPTTLFSEVSEQSRALSDIAESVAKDMEIDVFVVDKPPRYDTTSDPTGMKQKLTKYSNGVLASNTGATPRIFLVEQASLARAGVKARSDIFQQDGLHLTNKGLNFYTTNIIDSVKECFTDTKLLRQHTAGRVGGQVGGRAGSDGGGHPQIHREGRGQGRGNHGQNGGGQRGRDRRDNRNHTQQYYPPAPPPWTGRGRGRWGRDSYWDYPDQNFGGGYRPRY